MNFNKEKVGQFRENFGKAVKQLEKDYGCTIELGTIRFGKDELRAKMTAKIGERVDKPKTIFAIGDIVKVIHPKVDDDRRFKIVKINRKNIKLEEIKVEGHEKFGYGAFTASPSFLIKI